MSVERNKEIASIIWQQLGGNRFAVMTGVKYTLAIENGIRIGIGKNTTRANRLEIVLNCDDTYTMKFFQYSPAKLNTRTFEWRKESLKELKSYEHIFFDQLQPLFTEYTKLYTSLF